MKMRTRIRWRTTSLLLVLLMMAFLVSDTHAWAQMQAVGVRPELLRDVGIDQKLGTQVPPDLAFRDEQGNSVQIGHFFDGKPVVLALVYYQCPMLCTEILNGMVNGLKQVPMDAGKQYRVVTVSIDPRDRPVDARAKRAMYAGLYGRPGDEQGWRFLTGKDPEIHALANAVGFRYAYDSVSGQYAHAAAIMILSGEGTVSRYFYGASFVPRDLRLGLVDASADRIGSPVDQILLFCYHYDPSTGKYGVVISRVLQIAGLLTLLLIGTLILVLVRQTNTAFPRKRA